MMDFGQLKTAIAHVKQRTSNPFGVNLRADAAVRPPFVRDDRAVEAAKRNRGPEGTGPRQFVWT